MNVKLEHDPAAARDVLAAKPVMVKDAPLENWKPGTIAVGGAAGKDGAPRVALVLGDKQILLMPESARTFGRAMIAAADLCQGRD